MKRFVSFASPKMIEKKERAFHNFFSAFRIRELFTISGVGFSDTAGLKTIKPKKGFL
jgi:hypothetical protein